MKLALNRSQEKKVFRFFILFFWTFYWLLNVVDKFIPGKTFLWVGKDRLVQFTEYFQSIGIFDVSIPKGFLTFTTIIEFAAFLLFAAALWHFLFNREDGTHFLFFLGTAFSLFLFTFFSIGDQIFGDRAELLEHTTYWIAGVVSWLVYTRMEGR